MKARPSAEKRRKELQRQERARDKAALREQRRVDKNARGARNPEEDPDLAGIVPGPQPPLHDV